MRPRRATEGVSRVTTAGRGDPRLRSGGNETRGNSTTTTHPRGVVRASPEHDPDQETWPVSPSTGDRHGLEAVLEQYLRTVSGNECDLSLHPGEIPGMGEQTRVALRSRVPFRRVLSDRPRVWGVPDTRCVGEQSRELPLWAVVDEGNVYSSRRSGAHTLDTAADTREDRPAWLTVPESGPGPDPRSAHSKQNTVCHVRQHRSRTRPGGPECEHGQLSR